MKKNLLGGWHSLLRPWLQVTTGLMVFVLLTIIGGSAVFLTVHHNRRHLTKEIIDQTILKTKALKQKHQQLEAAVENIHQNPHQFSDFQKRQFKEFLILEDVQTKIQRWQKVLKIHSLSLKFGGPILYDSSLSLWKIPVTLNLQVLQDQQFYQLLERLQQQLLGHVLLKSFSLKRKVPLTSQMLQQIRQGKKNLHLFEGQIEFDWIYRQENQGSSLKSRNFG